MNEQSRWRRLLNWQKWAAGLFWTWNVIFLAFMFLGFAPQILPQMAAAVRTGSIPPAFLGYAVTLTLIPAVTVILGYLRLRDQPGRLFAMGYGVEGPLMILLGIRFFLVRDGTPGIMLLLGTAALGALVFLWQLLDHRIDQRGAALTHLRLMGMTLLLGAGLYASIWLAFYAVPMIAQSGQILAEFFREIWTGLMDLEWQDLAEGWRWIPFAVLGVPLLFMTGTLFALMPFALSAMYMRAWWQSLQALLTAYSRPRAVALTTAIVAAIAILFVFANQQPQAAAFALLETPPASPEEAKMLQQAEGQIRRGLLNAYLAPQRYLSTQGGMSHIAAIYQDSLNMTAQEAERVRALYEAVARPVIYDPVSKPTTRREMNELLQSEPQTAAELYEAYFDQTIIDGEREDVVQAVRSTWMIDQGRAGWQAVEDREVYLERQEITVREDGDMAEVELYEVYRNQTSQRQEVLYFFSLPESAVITGVWLNDSPDRESRFPYRVSPRGAAQAMYRSEVRRRIDPALVEQIGPRQYRLRIFPIEPQRVHYDEASLNPRIEDGPPMHLWLTYQVLAGDSAWPMPHLAEKFNVYWDKNTERLLNGQSFEVDEDRWLPETVPADTAVATAAHRFDFDNGQTLIVTPIDAALLPDLPAGLRLALVLDRSRSMADHRAEVAAALAELTAMAGSADIFLTASPYLGEEPAVVNLNDLDASHITFAGGQNAAQLLVQFAGLSQGQSYDAILVLTDGSGYKLDDSGLDVPIPEAPVWMVHLDGGFPLGYDDGTLEAIQASGGGATASVNEALQRLAFTLAYGEGDSQAGATRALVDGYQWMMLPTEVTLTLSGPAALVESRQEFAPLAARRFILQEMMAQRNNLDQLETLDQLHEIAIENSIVTPFSSMIVLVTDEQQRRLSQLEQNSDRYEREYEDVGETSNQDPLTVTGVPEPEEWLLIILGVGMLVWFMRQSRHEPDYAL